MAKIVSFNTDAPGLNTQGKQTTTQPKSACPERDCLELQVTSEYLFFAGQRELRAYVVTASKESKRYTHELPDKTALLGWFLDVLKTEPSDAINFVNKAERGEVILLTYPLGESARETLGFGQGTDSSIPSSAAA